MTGSKLLVPLRIPELGPSLGRLVTGTESGTPALDAPRLQLVTRLLEAAGEARRLASHEERDAALAAVGPRVWLDAWEEAVGSIAPGVVDRAQARIREAARRVRMPERLVRRLMLDASERRAVRARLGSAGATLVAALDQLERRAGAAATATPAERASVDAWQAALLLAARRVEASWIALERAVDAETTHWDALAARVETWRRRRWPLLAVSVPVLVVAVWLGLIFGGYLAPPDWLAHLWHLVMT